MPAWRAPVDNWVGNHHGIISSAHLTTLGCSMRTIRRMVRAGALVPVHPGVFRSSQWPDGHLQRLVAVCDRVPDATIAFATASKLWSWRRIDDDRIHILVPHGSAPAVEGVTGKYFSHSKITPSTQASYDTDIAGRLWDLSLDMI